MSNLVPYRFEVREGMPLASSSGVYVVWTRDNACYVMMWQQYSAGQGGWSALGFDRRGSCSAPGVERIRSQIVRHAPLPIAFNAKGEPLDYGDEPNGEAKPVQES